IAFPKTAQAQDLMADAPAPVPLEQVRKELKIVPSEWLNYECSHCRAPMQVWVPPPHVHASWGKEVDLPTDPLKCPFCGTHIESMYFRRGFLVLARNPNTAAWEWYP
ncbi:MAG TPA: hypothetical protein VJ085_00790, partial [Candidatus Acidoferrales bacterium]|nr:hypothetical protein [Candidatus Acidoferrales bacterium]